MRKLKANLRKIGASDDSASPVFFERMEPRILLSADALSGLVSADPFSDNDTARERMNADESAGFLLETYAENKVDSEDDTSTGGDRSGLLDTLQAAFDHSDTTGDSANSLDTLGAMLDGSKYESRQEIIFVDAATPDYQKLLDAVDTDTPGTDYQIFILQSDGDGIEQITEILAGLEDIDAIHLVSHGSEQGIQLGNGWLDQASLDGYAAAVGSWSDALDEDADLLIYGCNLAADVSGQLLIGRLAELTGADVAASDDLTGAATLGGDWQFEYSTGDIESGVAITTTAQQTWSNVLATINVTITSDIVDAFDGETSLREAITLANGLAGLDEIVLGAGTYTLSIAGNDNTNNVGDLDILDHLIIRGAGSASTIIDGNSAAINARVFETVNNSQATQLSISGLTITNGDAQNQDGGALFVGKDDIATLTDVVISNNQAKEGAGVGVDDDANLNLRRVIFANNVADDYGGAISVNPGAVVTGSEVFFDSNSAIGANGGAISNFGNVSLDRALFFDNSAVNGGAIHNEGGTVKLSNATLSSNSASSTGGAINNQEDASSTPGTLSITNSTLTGNTSAGINGIFQLGTSSISLLNSILNDSGSNLSGGIRTSIEYNIDSDNSAALGGGTNMVGDPMLDVLADNGGFTQTHALLSGSIAINAGTSTLAPNADQREQIRIGATDIGAYEFTDYGLIWGDVATDSIVVATLDGNHATDLITGLNDPTSVAIDPDAGKVYWVNEGDGRIQRANLDGSAVEDVVTGLTGPVAIDLYLAGGKIYWTDGSGMLSRANLDGSAQEVISAVPNAPTGVAVDGPGGMVYWVDDGSNSIAETGLTGTGTANLVTTNVNNTADLALDLVNDKIYWTNTVTGELWRANLSDGSGVINLNVGGSPYGLALDPVGNKTYWMDSVAGELYRVDLSNGANRITLYSGLADPRDVDFFTMTSLIKSPPNNPPTATNLSSTSAYNEGDASVAITDIVVSDADVGEIIKISLSLNNPLTGSLSANDGATYNAVTGEWALTDTVANVNTALANLVFNPNVNNDVDTSISVSIDDGDEDGSGALTGTITLDVTPINDPPTATNLSSTSAYNEGDASVPITDIVVSDVDTSEIITATLTLADTGTGSLSANDGATYTPATGIWTITDTVANVNAALANLVFNPLVNNTLDTSIAVDIDDGDEDGGGALTGTITLDVTPVNDPPTATNLTSTSAYNEGDASVPITDIVVSDVDTGEIITATLTLADTGTGSLSANDGATYTPATGIWTITDTVANVNTALANLVFVPTLNNDVDTSIAVSIDDGDEDASGPLTGTITLDVMPVNDAPTATNLSSTSAYGEGDASVPITDIVVSDVDTGEVITATLTLADTSTGSLSANDGATYTPATGVWTITDTVANVNTALANLVFVPNVNNDVDTTISVSIDDGDEDASGPLTGSITLDVTPVNDAPTATNLSSTSAYGEGAAAVGITDIVVSDVDTGEVITATLTLADTSTGSLSANDGATYTPATGIWTITDTVANVNTALANLVFVPTPNNDVDTTIAVSIDDGDEDASGPLTGSITLDVTPVNDAPIATNLSSISAYNEGDPTVAITDIVVSDVDTGEVITATLTLADTSTGSLSANDGATYTPATGVWTITDTVANVNTALANLVFVPNVTNDGDTTIAVSIDDGDEDASGPLTGSITLDVTPVNDAPTATNLSTTSAYNEGDPTVAITDIVVSDVDTAEMITATLTLADTSTGSLSANDGATYDGLTGIWTITDTVANVNTALANLVFVPTLNNEVDTTVSVSIDDGDEDASGPLTGTITLDVTPVNDAPTATGLSSSSNYNEGDASVALNDIVISDVDIGETVTATLILADVSTGSLSANDGATYNATTGVWTITGTVAQINTALANLEFLPLATNTLDTTIAVSIDDGDEDSSGPLIGAMTITVNPLPAVEPPSVEPPVVEPPVDEVPPDEPEAEDPAEEPVVETPDVDPPAPEAEPALIATTVTPAPGLPGITAVEIEEPVIRDYDNENAQVHETTTSKPEGVELLVTRLTEQLDFFDDPLQLIGAESFITRLNDMREELISETADTEKVIGSSLSVTAGLSVGYVVWLARSGVLLSSVLSSLPAWRFIDPLPVLGGLQGNKQDGDEESLESMVRENNDKTKDLKQADGSYGND